MSERSGQVVEFDAFLASVRRGVAALKEGGSLPPLAPRRAAPVVGGLSPDAGDADVIDLRLQGIEERLVELRGELTAERPPTVVHDVDEAKLDAIATQLGVIADRPPPAVPEPDETKLDGVIEQVAALHALLADQVLSAVDEETPTRLDDIVARLDGLQEAVAAPPPPPPPPEPVMNEVDDGRWDAIVERLDALQAAVAESVTAHRDHTHEGDATETPAAEGHANDAHEDGLAVIAEQVAAVQDAVSAKVSSLAEFVEQATAITRRSTTEQVGTLGESQAGLRTDVEAVRVILERVEAHIAQAPPPSNDASGDELSERVAAALESLSATITEQASGTAASVDALAEPLVALAGLRESLDDRSDRTDRRLDTIDARLYGALEEANAQGLSLQQLQSQLLARLDSLASAASDGNGASAAEVAELRHGLAGVDSIAVALDEVRALAASQSAHVSRIGADVQATREALTTLQIGLTEREMGSARAVLSALDRVSESVGATVEAAMSRVVTAIGEGFDSRLGDGPTLPELLAMFSEAHEQAYTHAVEQLSAQLQAQLSRDTREIALTVQSLTRKIGAQSEDDA